MTAGSCLTIMPTAECGVTRESSIAGLPCPACRHGDSPLLRRVIYYFYNLGASRVDLITCLHWYRWWLSFLDIGSRKPQCPGSAGHTQKPLRVGAQSPRAPQGPCGEISIGPLWVTRASRGFAVSSFSLLSSQG